MYKDKSIAVVVPAYNEELHILKVLEGMPDFVDAVYVVDDCSTDRTAEIVRDFVAHSRTSSLAHSRTNALTHSSEAGALTHSRTSSPTHFRTHAPTHSVAAAGPRIELVQHARNSGVGAAIVTGYKRTLADGLDIAVVMAGDNQMDPDELPGLLDPIADGRADYTKGDRTSRREHLVGMSPWRRLGNWLLRWLTRIAVGNMKVRDPQNGYTAASAELLAALPLDRLYPRYGYCNQLLAWVSVYKRRLVEVPMPSRYQGEKSKIRYGVYVPKLSWLLLKLFLTRIGGRLSAETLVKESVPCCSGRDESQQPSVATRQS